MKAISIRQPWAWAIVNAGKRVENRDWTDKRKNVRDAQRLIEEGETFLIHTGAQFEHQGQHYLVSLSQQGILPLGLRIPETRSYRQGGFVATAKLIGLIHARETQYHDRRLLAARNSEFFFGPYGLVLDIVHPFPFIPGHGQLGFFNVADDLAAKALAA